MSDCILTDRSLADGYGNINWRRFGKIIQRHHVGVWVDASGRLPDDGMLIRHLCGNRARINLDHLVEGTPSENMVDRIEHGNDPNANKIECKHGHPYDEENTRWAVRSENGRLRRFCRACSRRWSREWKERSLCIPQA